MIVTFEVQFYNITALAAAAVAVVAMTSEANVNGVFVFCMVFSLSVRIALLTGAQCITIERAW